MINRTIRWIAAFLILPLLLGLLFNPTVGGYAQAPVVRAVLFFSPTCGHCHEVLNVHLPPLKDKYGDQLQILQINVADPAGEELYTTYLTEYDVPGNRIGVPALLVGDQVLVGSREIPEQLPAIIDDGLANGGIDWPVLSGLEEVLVTIKAVSAEAEPTPGASISISEMDAPVSSDPSQSNPGSGNSKTEEEGSDPIFFQRFKRDLVGNSIAVLTLVGMAASLIFIGAVYVRGDDIKNNRLLNFWPHWAVPVLSVIGMAVAGYLTYVEVTQTQALCGPIGDCNTVQQSRYATLWGFLPVGVFGMLGYVGILGAWLLRRFGPEGWRSPLNLAIWGMALIGILFSIYLTFLEPFVIGATCAWCITSAVVITLIFIATTPDMLEGFEEE